MNLSIINKYKPVCELVIGKIANEANFILLFWEFFKIVRHLFGEYYTTDTKQFQLEVSLDPHTSGSRIRFILNMINASDELHLTIKAGY